MGCHPVAAYIYTQTIHGTTQITTNVEECGPCPIFASFTLAFALQMRKKHGKTSVRVRKTSVRLRKTSFRLRKTSVRLRKTSVRVENLSQPNMQAVLEIQGRGQERSELRA